MVAPSLIADGRPPTGRVSAEPRLGQPVGGSTGDSVMLVVATHFDLSTGAVHGENRARE
jgi:hypothetical protein